MNNDRFTQGAKHVLEFARRSAAELGHGYVGTEHLLYGLTREGSGVGAKVLRDNGLDVELVRMLIEKYVGIGAAGSAPAQGLTPRAKRVVELALGEANRLGHSYIGTEHLLMGILREHDSAAAKLILSAGANLNKLYTDIVNVFRSHDYSPRSAMGRSPGRDTKTLDQFSRDLTDAAAEGKLDPVIGRENEISRIIQILSRRTKNNPVLIGEPGVGKTAVAEGLAQKIITGDVPETLVNRRVVSLDLSGMVAGTKYRGDFEERIKTALEEVKKAGNVVLFIDELHSLVGAGAAEGAIDAANILKPALSRGELQLIGATTLNEYRKHIEKDAALERRFQPVIVSEPTQEQSMEILKGLRDRYEAHHKLKISDEAIEAAVKLSSRYINDRFLPDKAIDLVDEAASRVRMLGLRLPPDVRNLEAQLDALTTELESAISSRDFERAVTLRDRTMTLTERLEDARGTWASSRSLNHPAVHPDDIAAVISVQTGIPLTSVTEAESSRLLKLEETLHRRIIGQDEAVAAVSRAIRRGRVGLKAPNRPVGSFLFLGPTGVGKTELCRALAEVIFGDENAILRVDMSEFMEKHTVSKLIGSPPGYVGHDEGSHFTEKIRRRPYSVILFDELEKAHSDVFNVLLQIMEDGHLTDSQGRRVDFKNTIVVMTSNVGARNITEQRQKLGFSSADAKSADTLQVKTAVLGELKSIFSPEFLNRIDDIIVFDKLTRENLREIALGMLRTVANRVAALGVTITFDDAVVELLAERGFDPLYGARPLRRAIQSAVEDLTAERLLDGRLKAGDSVAITVCDGTIAFVTPPVTASAQ